MLRPKCPEGWGVLEQIEDTTSSYTSFTKWAKIHHNGEPQRIFVVFCEFNPAKNPTAKFTVRGGRHAKPDESLKRFDNIKDAQAYLLYVMESTDKWIEEINSPQYIEAYNKRIAKLVAEGERRNQIK